MRVVIAGGHGKIALLPERLLAKRGDQAVGLIRNPGTGHQTLELTSGDSPVAAAVHSL